MELRKEILQMNCIKPIIWEIKGIPRIRLTDENIKNMVDLYTQMQEPYYKILPPHRTVLFGIPFLPMKLILLLDIIEDQDIFCNLFGTPGGLKKRLLPSTITAIDAWDKICKELDWPQDCSIKIRNAVRIIQSSFKGLLARKRYYELKIEREI